jgi:orotate phosphoribosyltransferase
MPEPLQTFIDAGALLRGHFVYTSGRHGSEYLEKFRILENPDATVELAGRIASHFRPRAPRLIAGPTTGGVVLAYEVARQLGVKAVYAERRPEGGRILRRGFVIDPGTPVLIVDDIVTTGGSIREMLDCVRAATGVPIGIGVLGDRTGGVTDLGVPFFACLTVDFPSYPPEACPLCASGVPLTGPRGSRLDAVRT